MGIFNDSGLKLGEMMGEQALVLSMNTCAPVELDECILRIILRLKSHLQGIIFLKNNLVFI